MRSAASGGALTKRSLRRGQSYRVVVTGKAKSGSTVFDGQCVRYAGGWRSQHTLDLTTPAADHLSLYIQGVRVTLRVPGSSAACNAKAGKYVGVFRPGVNGRARVKVCVADQWLVGGRCCQPAGEAKRMLQILSV